VSEDIAGEIIDRAYYADEILTEATKRFIDRHIDVERRPPAPSVLREQDRIARRRRADRLPRPAPRYWRHGRQDTRARHQGRRRQAKAVAAPQRPSSSSTAGIAASQCWTTAAPAAPCEKHGEVAARKVRRIIIIGQTGEQFLHPAGPHCLTATGSGWLYSERGLPKPEMISSRHFRARPDAPS
jgi:hypothetical protein